MKELIIRNWVRVSMWMLMFIALFESFTVAQSPALKLIMWIGCGVLFVIGLLVKGEELLGE